MRQTRCFFLTWSVLVVTLVSLVVLAMFPRVDALASIYRTSSGGGINNKNNKYSEKVYQYFCFGSNALPSTMINLRNIQPLNATAAVLPGYELRFDGASSSTSSSNKNGRGRRRRGGLGEILEPSAAFVVPCSRSPSLQNMTLEEQVHGVLYTLTANDFARVGFTEGVPFAYRWQRCQVYPYVGKSGKDVGQDLLQNSSLLPYDAYTLVSPKRTIERDVPPSPSYMDIIRRGARYWNLDASYQAKLGSIPTAKNLLIPDGLSGMLLQLAEFSASVRRKR